MTIPRPILPALLLILAYGAAASLALALTRFDGGVAFLWVASAMLIADLMVRPRAQWPAVIAGCAVASMLATGFFGFGWIAAAPFAVVNMVEAIIAASLFRRHHDPRDPLGSLSWVFHLVLCVGIVAPAISGALAAMIAAFNGAPLGENFLHFYAGHALGNITFTPIALIFANGGILAQLRKARGRAVSEGLGLLTLVAMVSVFVFGQQSLPLLFLPMLPVILVTFRVGPVGAALAVGLIALIGGGLTLAGSGAILLVSESLGPNLQFFQLYLAATVLSALPVAADLQNRNRLHRKIKLSEERYRLLAERSTDILLHLELDGRIRYVSPSMRQIGGHDPAALVGRNSLVLVAPEHIEPIKAAHMAVAGSAGETHRYEYLGLIADGPMRWSETHSRAIIDENGEVESILSIARDISERKAIEQ